MEPLTTTTIGSFPLPESEENFLRCLKDQIKVGIDYPALPQLEDFCDLFLREIAEKGRGLKLEEGKYVVASPPEAPRELRMLERVELAANVVKRQNRSGLKVQITGPLTLALVARVGDKPALTSPEVVDGFVDAVAGIVDLVCSVEGVRAVFVDEPALSYALKVGLPNALIREALRKPLSAVPSGVERGLHVCGNVTDLSRLLLDSAAEILHHEFFACPGNFEVYSREDLRAAGKMLGIGSVSTSSVNGRIRRESEGEVRAHISKAVELFGRDRVVVAPDCGFRGFMWQFSSPEKAYAVAVEKLRTMVSAVKAVRKDSVSK